MIVQNRNLKKIDKKEHSLMLNFEAFSKNLGAKRFKLELL